MEGVAPLFRREDRGEERKQDGLWVIVNEYDISKLYNVADECLEDKLRDILGMSTVVQIRSLCKRMGVRKVSGIKKKRELIDAVISWGKKQTGRECELRVCPREDQAGVAHAISPIFLKLGLVKGFTQKLHRPKPFDLWILPSEYRPPPLVFQGKPLKTHQNMAVQLEALLLLLFSRFYFYLAWALVDPLLVHSESLASRGLILVNQCQSIVDHVMT